MALCRDLLGILLLTLAASKLAKAASACDGSIDCCCFNNGVAQLDSQDCCVCSCPATFSGEFCQTETNEKKIAKYTFTQTSRTTGGNTYWTLTMTSAKQKFPIKKGLRRKNAPADRFDKFTAFSVNDPSPTMTLRFRGPGQKTLKFIQGEFTTNMDPASFDISTISGNVVTLLEPYPFPGPISVKTYDSWNYTFPQPNNVDGLEFKFNQNCAVNNCFGINNLYGLYDLAISAPLNCDSECNTSGQTGVFENGCCNCTATT